LLDAEIVPEWREVPYETEVAAIIEQWHGDARDGCHGGKSKLKR